jgi:hypothetical protein
MVDGVRYGDKEFLVGYEVETQIQLDAILFAEKTLSQTDLDLLQKTFDLYDQTSHGIDIEAYALGSIGNLISPSRYLVLIEQSISKKAPIKTFESRVRDEFISRFTHGLTGTRFDQIGNNGEYPIIDAGKRFKIVGPVISITPANGELSLPPESYESKQAPAGPDPSTTKILDDVINRLSILPPECGVMNVVRSRFASMDWVPETKVVIDSRDIKIGCVTLRIYFPAFYYRHTELEAWYHYRVPQNVEAFVVQNAITCAVRASITAAVVGLIFWNPAAAGVAFSESFRACITNVVLVCADGSVTLIKVNGAWQTTL